MKLNRQMYLDRVYACWTGKNIGGTMGTPYEGKTQMQDISGFASAKGEPLANDDLDLQLIWLCAVEERGIQNITPQVLAEYWINYIPPHWNEYGIGKANLKLGLIPPYSGEYNNKKWRDSNGAWIRTEIWACLFPGQPHLAAKYAYADASVDHGLGEGTYAAMFVAALESAAFFENDIRKLISLGLSYIPENTRTSRSISLAVSLYDSKAEFKTAREAIVKDSEDLGWFQAPANVAFVVLGLLYGEGDYKKSMIHAINCGDDTDCTGATIGSIMGIMRGSDYVPKDWAEYIGDNIVSVAIDMSYSRRARSCKELTRRVYELVPAVFKACGTFLEYTDGETEISKLPAKYVPDFDIPSTGLSFDFPDLIYAKGRVEFDRCTVSPGDEINFKFIFKNTMPEPKRINIAVALPDTWSAGKTVLNLYLHSNSQSSVDMRVLVGEFVGAENKITVGLSSPGRPTAFTVPVTIWG